MFHAFIVPHILDGYKNTILEKLYVKVHQAELYAILHKTVIQEHQLMLKYICKTFAKYISASKYRLDGNSLRSKRTGCDKSVEKELLT